MAEQITEREIWEPPEYGGSVYDRAWIDYLNRESDAPMFIPEDWAMQADLGIR